MHQIGEFDVEAHYGSESFVIYAQTRDAIPFVYEVECDYDALVPGCTPVGAKKILDVSLCQSGAISKDRDHIFINIDNQITGDVLCLQMNMVGMSEMDLLRRENSILKEEMKEMRAIMAKLAGDVEALGLRLAETDAKVTIALESRAQPQPYVKLDDLPCGQPRHVEHMYSYDPIIEPLARIQSDAGPANTYVIHDILYINGSHMAGGRTLMEELEGMLVPGDTRITNLYSDESELYPGSLSGRFRLNALLEALGKLGYVPFGFSGYTSGTTANPRLIDSVITLPLIRVSGEVMCYVIRDRKRVAHYLVPGVIQGVMPIFIMARRD